VGKHKLAVPIAEEQRQALTVKMLSPGRLAAAPKATASGTPFPDEAFENEPGFEMDEQFRNMSPEKHRDLIERMERLHAGDLHAMDGWHI
jgi:hypothetical protein